MNGSKQYDAIVVGSGFGAAPPALRLAEAGLRVLILEKGPDIVPDRDFRQTQSPDYVRRYIKGLAGKGLNLTYAEGLGGGSGFYEMVSLRAPSLAFEQREPDGRRLWPAGLDRRTMDPHFELAERMLRVEQIREEEIPKTGLVFALLMKNLGYSCDRARYAARGCAGSGYCVTGCVFGAKQSLHVNYLPAAVAAGAEIRTGTEVLGIAPIDRPSPTMPGQSLSSIPMRWEVTCRDSDGAEARLGARILILAGGTVGSAALLLRSKKRLPRLSRHVGRNIAFNGSVKAAGLLPDHVSDADMYVGRSHPGVVSYEFLETHGIMITAAKPLPLQLMAGARVAPPGGDPKKDHWGPAHVALLKRLRHRGMVLYATGLTPPGGRITIDGEGNPVVSLSVNGSLRRFHERTHTLLESLLVRGGCTTLPVTFIDGSGAPYDDLHFFTAHQVGSCRMADTAGHGVVDAWGEVFHYPGLYVSDGATVPTSLAVNSSLTILANAERIAAGLVSRYAPRPSVAQRMQASVSR